ncbi:hypothetical protein ACMFMF_007946 [Clarireedia jacksonii]
MANQEAVCAMCPHCDKIFPQKSRLDKHIKSSHGKALSGLSSSRHQIGQRSPTQAPDIEVPCEQQSSENGSVDKITCGPTKESDPVSDDDDESVISEVLSTAPSLKRGAVYLPTPTWNERVVGGNLEDGTGTNRPEKMRKLNHSIGHSAVQRVMNYPTIDIPACDQRTASDRLTLCDRPQLSSRYDDNILEGVCHIQESFEDQIYAMNMVSADMSFHGGITQSLPQYTYTPSHLYQISFEREAPYCEPRRENFWDISSRVLDLEFPDTSNNPAGSPSIFDFSTPLRENQETGDVPLGGYPFSNGHSCMNYP